MSAGAVLMRMYKAFDDATVVHHLLALSYVYPVLQDDVESARKGLERQLEHARRSPARFPDLQFFCDGHVKPWLFMGSKILG